MSTKQFIKSEILRQLEVKIHELSIAIKSAEESRDADSKSSVGDKHETSRAKNQTEIDQLSKQLDNSKKQKNDLLGIDIAQKHNSAKVGSLIKTNNGVFFMSIGWGQVHVNAHKYFVISTASPIGQLLHSKKKGDSFRFRNLNFIITQIS